MKPSIIFGGDAVSVEDAPLGKDFSGTPRNYTLNFSVISNPRLALRVDSVRDLASLPNFPVGVTNRLAIRSQ